MLAPGKRTALPHFPCSLKPVESRIRGEHAVTVTLGTASKMEGDEYATFPRSPVTITHLPVTRCQLCDRTLAYRPGNISEVLTEHYRRAHRETLGIPAQ